jgi:hypothetical protein
MSIVDSIVRSGTGTLAPKEQGIEAERYPVREAARR